MLAFNLFQALISGLVIGWTLRLLIIPFKWAPERKTRILYWTIGSITAFMFPFYMGWYGSAP